MMNGGYLMVSKTDTNLYEKLNNALTLGKPVLFYEDENTCYYIDSITKSGTDIILTKGGKTITIESDGDVTENGNIQPTNFVPYTHVYRLSGSSDMGKFFSVTIQLILGSNEELTIAQLQIMLYNKEIMCSGVDNESGTVYDISSLELYAAPSTSGYNAMLHYMKDNGTIGEISNGTNTITLTKLAIF